MSNGRNLITQHLGAFYGGCFGSGAVFFKPIFLDAIGNGVHGFWNIVGFYGMKLLAFSITTVLGGLLTAWGKDLHRIYIERREVKKQNPPARNVDDKDDKEKVA